MNYDVKIKELTERIEKLEKAENKRIIKKKINIYSKIGLVILILVILLVSYIHINNKYIKPYKEKIDYINEKIESFENFTNNKLSDFQKYFK